MKTRKLISLGLAAAMCLSLSAAVFAEDPPANQTVFTATYSKPDIDVTVTPTAKVVLNPLGLDVDLSGTEADGEAVKGQQIVSNPAFITNNSKMNLSVSASVATVVEGPEAAALKLLASQEALEGTQTVPAKTDKSAFVFFEMKQSTLTDTSDASANNVAAVGWNYDYTETSANGVVTPADGCLILNATKAVTGNDLVTLKSVDGNGDPQAGSIAEMRLSGKMVKVPSKGEWAVEDKITATVTFTFMPATEEAGG